MTHRRRRTGKRERGGAGRGVSGVGGRPSPGRLAGTGEGALAALGARYAHWRGRGWKPIAAATSARSGVRRVGVKAEDTLPLVSLWRDTWTGWIDAIPYPLATRLNRPVPGPASAPTSSLGQHVLLRPLGGPASHLQPEGSGGGGSRVWGRTPWETETQFLHKGVVTEGG